MKILLLLILSSSLVFAGEFSGELKLENRIFFERGKYGNERQDDVSIALKPEYSHSWNQDRKVITFIPYFRQNNLDEQKNLVDIRELSYVESRGNWEIRAGISKVFWGVVESQHLVDVVNQVDFVAGPDNETKMGQLMFNPTYISKYGNFSYFLLPGFRERTFSGEDGRLRFPLPVDVDNAEYSDSQKENHIDHAIRWSHYYQNFDLAVSYFKGTDREAQFKLNNSSDELNPFYIQTEQVGFELQYLYMDWIFKSEIIQKDSEFVDLYTAVVAGFEYTFSNVFGGKDIGFIYEYLYDDRFENSTTGLYNSSFLGSRIAFNDTESSELLVGGFFNNEYGKLTTFRVEGSTRLNNSMKVSIEANIIDTPLKKSTLHQLRKEDYFQMNFSFYF